MKRSDMVRLLCAIINVQTHKTIDKFSGDYMCTLEEADIVLKKIEELGMAPPPVASVTLKGKDFPFGGMCTMRCNCEECDPYFMVNKWEKE